MTIEDIISKSVLISNTVTIVEELGRLMGSELTFVAPSKYGEDIEICMAGEGHNGEILYRSPNGTALFMAHVIVESYRTPDYGKAQIEFTIRGTIIKTLNAKLGSEDVQNYYMGSPIDKRVISMMPLEKQYYGKKVSRTLKLM